ncbi:putative RDD family membrane protein YckC [Labedella gwakjiensis]|uniref:Putative RDD family membrane protein YckC n=1 Tax=Labedella gwakjiensis TaxID=390269 RepID=A0A2P8GZL7_9MICO|nr:RDD family protein [Labedella gwakjiensis]PSL39414.1 putative RDD family membrane protein YckC [Labedella gwakjiensis]RUQ86180.1 RDD family protein [Labedella gwakjiensis]
MPREPREPADAAPSEWPGKRLGLPATGRLSVARLGRRIAALLVDQAPAYLLAFAFFRSSDGIIDGLALTLIFAAMQIVFIPTIGGSLGHRLLGMRVVAVDGGWIGLWRPIVRTVLLLLVIPAVIWDADQRGLHDKIAGTVLVRY